MSTLPGLSPRGGTAAFDGSLRSPVAVGAGGSRPSSRGSGVHKSSRRRPTSARSRGSPSGAGDTAAVVGHPGSAITPGGSTAAKVKLLTIGQMDTARAELRKFPEERSEDALPLIWKYVQALATELPSLRQLMNFKHTKPDALHELCRQLRLLSCPQGTVVYRQGSVGTSMFVVVAGYVDLRHSPEEAAGAAPRGGSDDQGVSIMHSGPGLRFGLHTALGDARLDTVISMGGSNPDQAAAAQKRRLRAADLAAQARGPAELLQIDAEAYRRLSSRLFQREAQGVRRRIAHFRKLKLFENWPDEELQFIATWSFDARFAADDVIFNEGDALLYVYFPTGGSVGIRKVRKAGVGSVGAATPTADVLIHLEVVSAPAHFGEAELCRDRTTRETSVVALEDTTAIVIAGSVFQSTILGDRFDALFSSKRRVRSMLKQRDAWHNLRWNEWATSPDLPFAFMREPQAEILPPSVFASEEETAKRKWSAAATAAEAGRRASKGTRPLLDSLNHSATVPAFDDADRAVDSPTFGLPSGRTSPAALSGSGRITLTHTDAQGRVHHSRAAPRRGELESVTSPTARSSPRLATQGSSRALAQPLRVPSKRRLSVQPLAGHERRGTLNGSRLLKKGSSRRMLAAGTGGMEVVDAKLLQRTPSRRFSEGAVEVGTATAAAAAAAKARRESNLKAGAGGDAARDAALDARLATLQRQGTTTDIDLLSDEEKAQRQRVLEKKARAAAIFDEERRVAAAAQREMKSVYKAVGAFKRALHRRRARIAREREEAARRAEEREREERERMKPLSGSLMRNPSAHGYDRAAGRAAQSFHHARRSAAAAASFRGAAGRRARRAQSGLSQTLPETSRVGEASPLTAERVRSFKSGTLRSSATAGALARRAQSYYKTQSQSQSQMRALPSARRATIASRGSRDFDELDALADETVDVEGEATAAAAAASAARRRRKSGAAGARSPVSLSASRSALGAVREDASEDLPGGGGGGVAVNGSFAARAAAPQGAQQGQSAVVAAALASFRRRKSLGSFRSSGDLLLSPRD